MKNPSTTFVASVIAAFSFGSFANGAATVTEAVVEMPTYPFSDPDPVPAVSEKRYPYFRYDGSTAEKENKAWKTVVLENEKIRVTMMPDIGGKVWGAYDKKSGGDFI